MMAKIAGYFQPPSRSALATTAIIHGSATHGSTMIECFAEYCSVYGVSM